MNKRTLQIGGVLLGLLVLVQPVVFTAIVSLLFLGIVPGTNIVIPFWAMAIFYIISCFALFEYIGRQPLYIGDMKHQEKVARQLAREKVLNQAASRKANAQEPEAGAYTTAPSTNQA